MKYFCLGQYHNIENSRNHRLYKTLIIIFIYIDCEGKQKILNV